MNVENFKKSFCSQINDIELSISYILKVLFGADYKFDTSVESKIESTLPLVDQCFSDYLINVNSWLEEILKGAETISGFFCEPSDFDQVDAKKMPYAYEHFEYIEDKLFLIIHNLEKTLTAFYGENLGDSEPCKGPSTVEEWMNYLLGNSSYSIRTSKKIIDFLTNTEEELTQVKETIEEKVPNYKRHQN